MKSHLLTIVAVSGCVMFTNLGGPRLWDRDEPRNAGCAAEMLERGDWVTPVFNGELRTHKPVLLYWCMMTAYKTFGVNEFAARFWSAFLAIGTCLLTYGIGRTLFSERTGLWAAIILSTTLMFDVAGRSATPDSLLIFWGTASLTWYLYFAFPRSGTNETLNFCRFPASWKFGLGLYSIMAVGTLTKGPVGVILPTAVIGLFLLIHDAPARYGSPQGARRLFRPITYFFETCWKMRILSATLIVLAIASPWYIWVGVRTDGVWLQQFFLEHNVGRAMNSMEGHGGSPLFFYPLALMVGFMPWSIFFAPTVIDAWKRFRIQDPHGPRLLFLGCWIVVYLVLFSFASTKLPSYITPCYPALALLTSEFLHRWIGEKTLSLEHWPKVSFSIWGAVGIGVLVVLPVVADHFLPGQEWLGAVGLIPLVSAVICLRYLRRQQTENAVKLFGGSALLTVWIAFCWIMPAVDKQRRFNDLIVEMRSRSSKPTLGEIQTLEPSWVFYSQETIYPLHVGKRGHKGQSAGVVPLKHDSQDLKNFLRKNDHFVLMTREKYERVKKTLPAGTGILAERPYFLRDRSLLLVGHETPQIAVEPNSTLLQ